MYAEEDLLHISALQHLVFCERQCALIYLEEIWNENLFTAKGQILHERVNRGGDDARGEVRIRYSLELRSLKIGLVGKADAVEFQKMKTAGKTIWKPFPVEYKSGKPKPDECDKVQLCAQAMCLEEMLDTEISEGAIFYGKIRRRLDVGFDEELRTITINAALRLHELIKTGVTPEPVYTPKCKSCSLVRQCLPRTCAEKRSAQNYVARMAWEK